MESRFTRKRSLERFIVFFVLLNAVGDIAAQFTFFAPPAGLAAPPTGSPSSQPPPAQPSPSPPSSSPPAPGPTPFWLLSPPPPPPASPPPPPLEGNIFDKIRADSSYSVIVKWLDGSTYGNPSVFNMLATQPQYTSQSLNWTIFLPTNDAMNGLKPALINYLQNNQTMLTEILLDFFVGAGGPPQTGLDQTVTPSSPRYITATSTGTKLGLVVTRDPFDGTLYINNVTLGKPDDILAANGVVHGVTGGLILQPSYFSADTCQAAFYNCAPGTPAPPPPSSPPPNAPPPGSLPPLGAKAPHPAPGPKAMGAPSKAPSKAPAPSTVPGTPPASAPTPALPQAPQSPMAPTPMPPKVYTPVGAPTGGVGAPGPAAGSISEQAVAALQAAGVYTTFLSLAPLLGPDFTATVDLGSMPMTILAPTDSAFSKKDFVDYFATLSDSQRSLLLKYHIINGYYNASALLANNATYKTMVVGQMIIATIDAGVVSFQPTDANASPSILTGLDAYIHPVTISVQGISRVLMPSFVLNATSTMVPAPPPPPSGHGVKGAQLLPGFAYLLVALVSFHLIWATTP